MDPKPNILLAEDSFDDAFLISHALKKGGIGHALVRVKNGEEAITYLSEKPRPDFAILDLKMPILDGFDVLAFIQRKPEFKGLPVIVLTGSELPRDKSKAAELGAADYFVKSPEWESLASALKLRFSQLAGD